MTIRSMNPEVIQPHHLRILNFTVEPKLVHPCSNHRQVRVERTRLWIAPQRSSRVVQILFPLQNLMSLRSTIRFGFLLFLFRTSTAVLSPERAKVCENYLKFQGHELESEDDCFADILNDDIINLDESSKFSTLQGTAQRRIRLKLLKISTAKCIRARKNVSVAGTAKNKGFLKGRIHQETMRPIKSFIFPMVNCRLIFIVLTLLVLLLPMFREAC